MENIHYPFLIFTSNQHFVDTGGREVANTDGDDGGVADDLLLLSGHVLLLGSVAGQETVPLTSELFPTEGDISCKNIYFIL